MLRKLWAIFFSLTVAASLLVAADAQATHPKLTATQIADKNAAASGGLQTWRGVQTMTLKGKLSAGGNQRPALELPGTPSPAAVHKIGSTRPTEEVQLPFVMELKRPRQMRFELQFNGETAVQVFDGANGWKLRPFLNRRVVEPYTSEELKTTATQADLDGPLIDYAAKGTRVDFVSTDKVEDRDTYKLKLTMKSGQMVHVWIDAETFLQTKIEGQPRRLDGIEHPVEIYFRDYRPINGLQIPFVLETRVLPVAHTVMGMKDPAVPSEKTFIEAVVINPKFDESLFTKPTTGVSMNGK